MNTFSRFHRILTFVPLLVFLPRVSAEPSWQVFQLTSGTVQNRDPAVSGTTYVWKRRIGVDGVIMKWAEGEPSPTQISSTDREELPKIESGKVVWSSRAPSGGDYEIKTWESGVETVITANSEEDRFPDIGGDALIWYVNTWHIEYRDGVQELQITEASGHLDRSVHGDWVVWAESVLGVAQVFLWDAGAITQLTNTSFDNRLPETDGASIVWQGSSGPSGTGEVYRWTPSNGTTRLTLNSVHDTQPDVSGDVIVFVRHDGTDYEIFFRYLGVDYQMTDNDYDDFEPAISGNRVVWHGSINGVPQIFYAVIAGLIGGEPAGACCNGLDCTQTTESVCDTGGGTFQGAETLCHISSCPAAIAPATGWSTYQHDYQRTGRTSAVVPSAPTPLWSAYTGVKTGSVPLVAPVIGPNEIVYVNVVGTGNGGLTGFHLDGTLNWVGPESAHATASIRADGNLFVAKHSTFAMMLAVNGSGGCGVPDGQKISPAIDQDGNVYFGGIRSFTASCQSRWSYPGGGTAVGHLALDQDGHVVVSLDFNVVRLDKDTGLEFWNVPVSGRVSPPAVADDGTVVVFVTPNTVLALNPDGTEKWTLPLSGIQHSSSIAASPAIGADGTIYVVARTNASEMALLAITEAGSEIWRFVEPINTGENGFPPVVDGSNIVLFSVRVSDIIAVDSSGSEAWRIVLPGEDHPGGPPAVGDDGTIYVNTADGYLIAYGADGCELPAEQAPLFTFRRVVSEQEIIDGLQVGAILDFDVLEDGRVTFMANLPSLGGLRGVYTEATGGFESVLPGDTIDGQLIADVWLMRYDFHGNEYLPAQVDPGGRRIFRNREVLPAFVNNSGDWRQLNVNASNRILVGGTANGVGTGLLSYFIPTGSLELVVGDSQVIDGFVVTNLEMAGLDGFGDDQGAAFRALNGVSPVGAGILDQNDLVARAGDVVGGRMLVSPKEPVRTPGGKIYFRDEGVVYRRTTGNAVQPVKAPGDPAGSSTIVAIDAYDVNRRGDLAYRAAVLGGTGIFWNDRLVVMPSLTEIEGNSVGSVSVVTPVRINHRGEIAFVANVVGHGVSLWVASLDASFDSNEDGDVDMEDLDAFDLCYQGQSAFCTCLVAFDADGDREVTCSDFTAFSDEWTDEQQSPYLAACESEDVPLAMLAEPSPLGRNRFIVTVPPVSDAEETAIRVELTSLHHPASPPNAPDFSAFEGEFRYVTAFQDGQGNPVFDCPDSVAPGGTYKCATLGCTPEYLDWVSIAAGEPLRIISDAVVPSSSYIATQLPKACIGQEEVCSFVSPTLVVSTSQWGDVGSGGGGAPDNMTNVIDIGLIVDTIKGVPSALPESRAWLKNPVNPIGSPPNVIDIGLVVDAVKGFPYPYGISLCP